MTINDHAKDRSEHLSFDLNLLERWREFFRKYLKLLCDVMYISPPILVQLYCNRIITEHQMETLEIPGEVRFDRNLKLIKMLQNNPESIDHLINIFSKDFQHIVVWIFKQFKNSVSPPVQVPENHANIDLFNPENRKQENKRIWRHKVREGIGMFNCPLLENKLFVGRQNDLECLQLVLQVEDDKKAITNTRIAVVTAPSGTGKSALVRHFVDLVQSEYTNIVWIPSESRKSIVATFAALADRYSISFKGGFQEEQAIRDVYFNLLQHKTLLVFDNAYCFQNQASPFTKFEVTGVGLADFLPSPRMEPLRKYPNIIITSVSSDWLALTSKLVTLRPLSQDASKEYISKRLDGSGIDDVGENGAALANYFGHIPIGLETAVDAILFWSRIPNGEETYNISALLQDLEEQDEESPKRESWNSHVESIDISRRFEILQTLTFHKMEKHRYGPIVIHMLDRIANLPRPLPQLTDIPEHTPPAPTSLTPEQCALVIKVLQSLSLITLASNALLAQRRLQSNDEMNAGSGENYRVQHVSTVFEDSRPAKTLHFNVSLTHESNQPEEIYIYKSMSPRFHLTGIPVQQTCFTLAEALEDTEPEFSSAVYNSIRSYLKDAGIDDFADDMTLIDDKIIQLDISLGKLNQAELLIQATLRNRLYVLGKHHPASLSALSLKAALYLKLARHEEALEALQDVYSAKVASLGPNHPETIDTKTRITQIRCGQRNIGQPAAPYAEESKLAYREEGPRSLKANDALAVVLGDQGENRAIISRQEKVCDSQYVILESEGRDTLSLQKHIKASYILQVNNNNNSFKPNHEEGFEQNVYPKPDSKVNEKSFHGTVGADHIIVEPEAKPQSSFPESARRGSVPSGSGSKKKTVARLLENFQKVFSKKKKPQGENPRKPNVPPKSIEVLYKNGKIKLAMQLFMCLTSPR